MTVSLKTFALSCLSVVGLLLLTALGPASSDGDNSPADVGTRAPHELANSGATCDVGHGDADCPPTETDTPGTDQETDEEAAELSEEFIALGNRVYLANCSTCHGRQGNGGAGPELGAGTVDNQDRLVIQVLYGSERMPAFGTVLSNEEIAAVATHIRTSWENEYGAITEEEVEEIRSRFE